jgi:hypothetical protein
MKNLAMTGLQRAITSVRRYRAARNRRPPELRFGASETGAPCRIFYLSPDPPGPRGGVRVLYRHVDVLNSAGFDAAVIHHTAGYRANWFAHDTRTVAARDIVVTPHDVLVVPEFYGAAIATWPTGQTVVLFDQGAYYTFDGMSVEDAKAIDERQDAAILTVSEDSLRLLRYAFPHSSVTSVRSVIEEKTFHPGAYAAPRRRIAYAANRRAQERHELLSILELRGRLDWGLVPIRGMSETQVAETLRSCAIFLAFNEREGFGLPPAEAMASGCYVIGYHGQGAEEFFDPAYCRPVPESDLLDFAEAIEQAAASYDADPRVLTDAGLAASRAVLGRYHLEGLRTDLVAFFAELGVDRISA